MTRDFLRQIGEQCPDHLRLDPIVVSYSGVERGRQTRATMGRELPGVPVVITTGAVGKHGKGVALADLACKRSADCVCHIDDRWISSRTYSDLDALVFICDQTSGCPNLSSLSSSGFALCKKAHCMAKRKARKLVFCATALCSELHQNLLSVPNSLGCVLRHFASCCTPGWIHWIEILVSKFFGHSRDCGVGTPPPTLGLVLLVLNPGVNHVRGCKV